jgi:hypothetical protein
VRNPRLSSVGMQALRLRCYRDEPRAVASLLSALRRTLNDSDFSYLALHALDNIRKLQAAGNCPGLEAADVQSLADALLANRHFNAPGAIRQRLRLIKAEAFIAEHRPAEAAQQLRIAYAAKRDPQALLLLYGILRSTGQTEAASDLLARAAAQAPANPWARENWLSVIAAASANAGPRRGQ